MCTSQTIFSLKGQSLKCDHKDSIHSHLQNLISHQDIRIVILGGNTFGFGACQHLASILKEKKYLEEADLADIFTGRLISEIPQSLASLCNSLLDLQHLTRLDLSDNAFGGRCVDVMVPFLSSHLPLEELRLTNNGLGPTGATVIAHALVQLGLKAKQFGQTSRLKKIICGRNRCENGSTHAWGKVFQIHPELIEVRLYQNDIRNHGWHPIMAGLTHCPKLQILDMYDNTATEKGSLAVANALPHLTCLRELNLGDCLLRPRGGAIIARALKLGSNPNLELLKLSGSEIDEQVVALLVEYVKQFGSQLKKVELNDNFGDAQAAGELSGIWGAMKDALDAWDNGAELDELDEIIERDSDDEEDTSQESEDDDEQKDEHVEDGSESEDEEKKEEEPEEIPMDQENLKAQQVEPTDHEEEKPRESINTDIETVVPQLKEIQIAPQPLPVDTHDHDAKNFEIIMKEPETTIVDHQPMNSSSSPKKADPSRQEGLYNLLTQTIEALKLT